MAARPSRRYAQALFELAREQECLDRVVADMTVVQTAIASSAELRHFLSDTTIPRPVRVRTLTSLFTTQVAPLTLRFLLFVDTKRRGPLLADICQALLDLHAAAAEIVDVRLTTAAELPTTLAPLKEMIRRQFGAAARVETRVDPALIGGFSIRAGDMIYDMSITAVLENARRKFMHTRPQE